MFIDRKKYLFDNIRQFCSTEESAILTCPEPARGEGPPTKRKKGKDASTPICPEPARGEGTQRVKCFVCRQLQAHCSHDHIVQFALCAGCTGSCLPSPAGSISP